MILLIKEGVVENAVLATIEEAKISFPNHTAIESNSGGIGWEYIDGILVEPYKEPEPPYIPQSLKMAQCRAQLIIDGKDDDVEALIDSTEDLVKKKLYRAYWEYEPLVLRDNAMINEMAALLNIDLDVFFVNASKL